MTKQEYHALKADWLATLSQLWDAYGKEVNAKQFKAYATLLGDVPLGVLEHVIREVISAHKYNSVPTLGEIQAVLNEMQHDDKGATYVSTTPFANEARLNRKDHTLAELQKSWVPA